MSLNFTKLAFKKLHTNEIVASKGNIVLRKLSLKASAPDLLENGQFDISTLNLPAGTYKITVTALAEGYLESDHSDPPVDYVVY